MNDRLSPIKQAGTAALLSLLDDDLTQAVLSISTERQYGAGQLIHSRGDNAPGLSIVKSGAVSFGVYGVDGTFVLAGMLGPGEAFGEFTLFTDLPRTHDVSAVNDCVVYQAQGDRFLSLCRREYKLTEMLLKSALIRTHMLLELLDAMRRLPVLERTAKMLLSLSYTSGSGSQVVCRQSDLAVSIGVSRVTLGKVLKRLESENLIELGYRQVRLTDRANLEGWLESRNTTPLKR